MAGMTEWFATACGVALALALPGCDECSDAEDCPEGESCVSTQGEMQCAIVCNPTDDDCPEGQTCSGNASSCSGCEDMMYVCR